MTHHQNESQIVKPGKTYISTIKPKHNLKLEITIKYRNGRKVDNGKKGILDQDNHPDILFPQQNFQGCLRQFVYA